MKARTGLHQLFFGPEGLRAGWGVLVYSGIFILTNFGMVLLVAVTIQPRRYGYGVTYVEQWKDFCRDVLFFKGTILVAALVATLVMARIERRAILSYWRVAAKWTLRVFMRGAVAGFALFAATIGLIAMRHGYALGIPAMSASEAFHGPLVPRFIQPQTRLRCMGIHFSRCAAPLDFRRQRCSSLWGSRCTTSFGLTLPSSVLRRF